MHPPDSPQDVGGGDVRQAFVEQDQVKLRGSQFVQSFLAAPCGRGVVAVLFEERLQRHQEVLVVVHDQDSLLHCENWLCGRGAQLRLASAGRLHLGTVLAAWTLTGPFLFDPADRLAQPFSEDFLELIPMGPAFDGVHRIAQLGQWDMVAWDLLLAAFRRDEGHQNALFAEMRPRRFVEVDAGRGVLKYGRWPPRRPDGTSVIPFRDEVQLEFKNFENVAIVWGVHLSLLL